MNNRLVVIGDDTTPDNEALEFTSLVGVKNYYGLGSKEVRIAEPFFCKQPFRDIIVYTRGTWSETTPAWG